MPLITCYAILGELYDFPMPQFLQNVNKILHSRFGGVLNAEIL